MSLVPVKFGKDPLAFFVGVSKLAARARARPERDADGDPIWDLIEWKAFCRGVREYAHLQVLGLGMAAYRTALEVEAMLEDEYDATGIHNVLKGTAAENDRHWRAAEAVSYPPAWYLVDLDQT